MKKFLFLLSYFSFLRINFVSTETGDQLVRFGFCCLR